MAERGELGGGEAALGLRAHADGPRSGIQLRRRPEVVSGEPLGSVDEKLKVKIARLVI